MPGGRGRRLVVLGFALPLAGCVSLAPKHEYELSPGRAFHPGMKSALVLPINETLDVPPGLQKGEREILDLLVASLEAEGLRVETPEPHAYHHAFSLASRAAEQEVLSASSGSVSESVDFSRLLPHLLSELGAEVDLVVLPNMVLRSATATGGKSVRWDGVQRRQAGAGGRSSFTGTTTAASLWVVIYASDGTRIFSGFGGLDLLFAVDMREERMVLIEDRLEDVDNLREGVCVALHPFFGEDPSCRQ